MAVNVSIDAISDGMIAQLAATMVPAPGSPVSALRPAYIAQRYTGAEFSSAEGFKRGITGRCPALLVRHAGTRTLRTYVGRRVDRVESTFVVIVATDSHRSKDGRRSLFVLAEGVRHHLGSHSFGLAINPLRFQRVDVLRDDEQLLALAVAFTTKHRVDYTIDAGDDTIEELHGQVIDASVTHSPKPHEPTVVMHGTSGATLYAWRFAGIDSDGKRTLLSDSAEAFGPDTLDGDNFARISWDAVPGIALYEVSRYSVDGGTTNTGVIGTTTGTSFDDTGLSVINATPPDSHHFDINEGLV